MLVPVGAAFRALARAIEFRPVAAALAIAVTTGAIEFWTIIARAIELGTIKLGTIEFGPLAERTIARRPIVARTREPRTVVAAFALLPGLVFAAIAAAKILARTLAEILARRPVAARTRIALLPRLRIAALATIARAVAAVRCAARELPFAVELTLRAVATRCGGPLVAELPVTGPAGGAGIVAIPAARRTVVTAIGRAIAARLERPLLAVARAAIRKRTVATRLEAALTALLTTAVVALEARAVAEIAARGIALFAAAERTALAVTAGWAAVALALKAALGELLLGAARLAGTALGRASITPAAGIVVFVAVARHE
ncbi:hypothetical protein ABIF53_003755 [Bradyrhizobium japonicum]